MSSIRHLFKDKQLQDNYLQNGYVIFPLLSEFEISQLNEIYEGLSAFNNTNCLAINTVLSDKQNVETSNAIVNVVSNSLIKYFLNFDLLGGVFSVKEKSHPELPFHQDTTIIDTEEDIAYTIWIPLVDVNRENGALFIIPKSHLFFNNYISYTLPSRYIDRKLLPNEYIDVVDMKAGDAIVFSNKLFHGSFANKSERSRIAVVLTITNKEAKLVYYDYKDNLHIIKYEVKRDDYLNSYKEYSIGKLPSNAKLIKEVCFSYFPIDYKTIYKKITGNDYTLFLKLKCKYNNFLSNNFFK
ncbi:MAG: phytanoyl-CoA dioxygenase family protein [Chitinophagales bacterium]